MTPTLRPRTGPDLATARLRKRSRAQHEYDPRMVDPARLCGNAGRREWEMRRTVEDEQRAVVVDAVWARLKGAV